MLLCCLLPESACGEVAGDGELIAVGERALVLFHPLHGLLPRYACEAFDDFGGGVAGQAHDVGAPHAVLDDGDDGGGEGPVEFQFVIVDYGQGFAYGGGPGVCRVAAQVLDRYDIASWRVLGYRKGNLATPGSVSCGTR